MEKILSDLKAMRLPGMARTWQNLMEAHRTDSISLTDGIRLLIQGENDMRMSNRTHRLIKNAHFRYTVTLGEIRADSVRGIEQSLLNEVATCDYITHGYPIIITGPTGTGKSWLASALGHHACLCGYKVRLQRDEALRRPYHGTYRKQTAETLRTVVAVRPSHPG